MGCNGWNHPPGCDCGWGGQYHGDYGGFSHTPTPKVQTTPSWSLAQFSITRNAQCPVCGAPVFFYKNNEGSRVFFDSLGPPWPKHPCTDDHLGGKRVPHPSATGPRTLQALLSQPIIDGGLWKEIFDLLVNDLGVPPSALLNNHNFKQRSLAYIGQVKDFLNYKRSSANTMQDRHNSEDTLGRLYKIESDVTRLIKFEDAKHSALLDCEAIFNDTPQLTQDLEWESLITLRSTHMTNGTTVVNLFSSYPSTLRTELLILGHMSVGIGAHARVLRISGSRLYILHIVGHNEIAVFAVQTYLDINLLHSKL